MAIHHKIYDTESVEDIVRKIYFNFEVNASCTIYGFIMNEKTEELVPKGEVVIQRLKWWYETENIAPNGRRIWKYKDTATSLGGPIAHKIFSWEVRIVDSEPRYTIWRVQ